jgi:polysaccharide export outer membrane protein
MKHACGLMRVGALLGLVLLVLVQLGCAGPGANRAAGGEDRLGGAQSIDTTYRPGDKMMIDFADSPGMPSTWLQTVREDGTITLPLNQTIAAAGKKKGEIEQEIHALYVPKMLRRLTVNVRAEERFYFVRGEVKQPGQRPHTGSITALKAISAAGDFTDFANRKRVEVIRTNGEKLMLNATKALDNPQDLDIPVYPGDTIYVHRRFF